MKVKHMPLDIRLTCIKIACNEEWEDLEVLEVDGKLIIQVKEPDKTLKLLPAPKTKKTKRRKCGYPIGHLSY